MRPLGLGAALVLALVVVVVSATRLGVSQGPGPDNFEHWLRFIQPSPEERAWEAIGWRNELGPAMEEARRLGRPILLWTMDGHPLACT